MVIRGIRLPRRVRMSQATSNSLLHSPLCRPTASDSDGDILARQSRVYGHCSPAPYWPVEAKSLARTCTTNVPLSVIVICR
jgi:hypothetical protein